MIREMHRLDYPQVMALWSNTEAMQLRDADSEANIARYLEKNPGLSFVALEGNAIIGAILVGTDGRRGYVQHLAIAQSHRGKGIGKAILTHAISALAEQGICKTHLFVANDNLDAQKFYQKLNWFERDEVKMFSFNASTSANV